MKQKTSGPFAGMRSRPYARSGANVRTSPPKNGRPTSQANCVAVHWPRRGEPLLDELLDAIDDVVDLEVGRVDLLRVGRRAHARGVALVADAQVGRERVAADVGALGLAPARTHVAVRVEVDLHLRVRRDDGADVAALDHDVALLAELALALAHDLADRRMTRDDRDLPVDARLADRRGHVRSGDRDAAAVAERRPDSPRRARRAAHRRPSGRPRCIASHVSARYIAPVSR